MTEATILVDSESILEKNTKDNLKNICYDLKEHGYDPIKQIACYLISGDPGYISSYKECRNRISKFDRNAIIESMLKNYIK